MRNLVIQLREKSQMLPFKIKGALFFALVFALGIGILAFYVSSAESVGRILIFSPRT